MQVVISVLSAGALARVFAAPDAARTSARRLRQDSAQPSAEPSKWRIAIPGGSGAQRIASTLAQEIPGPRRKAEAAFREDLHHFLECDDVSASRIRDA
jgi:hypothetical protein